MTVEHGSSLHSTATASDSVETPDTAEDGRPPAGEGSTRFGRATAIRHWARRWSARWRSIVATMLVVASVGVAAGVYFFLYRPDQQVGDAAAHRAIQTASDGAVAVLSYEPEHVDHDFARAKSYLTGDFLAYYTKFTEEIAAMALQKHVTQTAKVVRAAVSELHRDSAVVLVFLNLTAASKEKPQPQVTGSGARVTLTKVKGSWLISKLDPLS